MKIPFVSEKNRQPVKTAGKNVQPDTGDAPFIVGLSELYVPEDSVETPQFQHQRDLADVLLEMQRLTPQQLAQIRAMQKAKPNADVAALLWEAAFCSPDDILMAKAKIRNLEFRHITPKDIQAQAFQMLDIDFIRSSAVCPVALEEDTLLVATPEPENIFAVEEIKKRTGMNIRLIVCTQQDIDAVCQDRTETKVDANLDDIISDMSDVELVQDREDEVEDLEKMAGQSPIIKFVNFLISNAIHENASDIHIEPKDKFTKIRYRIDGILFEMKQSPIKMHPAIVSRIKIMSNLDISERRLPQDGKISVLVGGREVDLRVSILPTCHGEKVVIRVLDSKSIVRGLEHLGMEPSVMKIFGEQITLPHGIILVTGPTGSGKSTTLYSSLIQMDKDKLNISTVEDPVEYELEFCNQVHVNDKVGLTFATALRSLLRQDPDVIMIGEIRDNETARIAVQAALTGHLVLSTLHTNDAASSITRLVNIGIDPYLIAASLNAVLAQRLVRKICSKCKEPYDLPGNMRKYAKKTGIKADQVFHGKGCPACRESGYSGRVGIYEFLVIDDKFNDMINKDASVSTMRKAFQASGQPTLFDDGMKKVQEGLTTVEEVLRVTEVYGISEDEAFVENVR